MDFFRTLFRQKPELGTTTKVEEVTTGRFIQREINEEIQSKQAPSDNKVW